jgi:Predicted esterase of the alpha/beta hydrolase fold
MKKALLIHGWGTKNEFYNQNIPTASNCHWFPWLSKQLMIRDIHTVALEMPDSYYPKYEVWKKELERFELDEETILIGHSCGGGFIVRYLSENNIKIGRVILVAPWLGISFDDSEPFDENFFKFDIDSNLAERTESIILMKSANDDLPVQSSVKILEEEIDSMKIVEFANKGHFTFRDLGSEEFPELLEEVLR